MKTKHLLAAIVCLSLSAMPLMANDTFINLTPRPHSLVQGSGSYVLPQGLSVGIGNLDETFAAEATKFVKAINTATPLQAITTSADDANITVTVNKVLPTEGYNLNVTPSGITIEAATPRGLFYAFQSIKKVLPPNVMAGKMEAGTYEIPVMEIIDEPAYEYRGFMLDVCRHFFTVEEVKRIIDVMSYYKMNAFHWHLSEDQGWRMEVPKWPKLTTVGATAPDCRFTDFEAKTQYWINRPYGPYFYTIDEMKDVVAYAAERHVDVIPEIEFPGHGCAALAAYPELSCTPNGSHSVKNDGGVYGDVFNIANPLVMQFAKDVIDVMCEVFPAELIHTGGDECPTGAWVNNAECQAMVAEMGFTGNNDDQKFRKLQNWFTNELAKYAATKGKRIAAWNESITSGGADLNVMKESNATIFCWTGPDNAVNVGTNNGLRVVYTPYSSGDGKKYDGIPSNGTKGSFYINRKQDPNDAPANGNTWDTVDKVYNTHPFTDNALNNHPELCYGVQGTFWTERVSDHEYLEWLALPRLIAIAEIGWTKQNRKDFNDFITRVKADTKLLDLNGYRYSPYFLEDVITTPDPVTEIPAIEPLKKGATYVFVNATPGFDNVKLADFEESTNLNATVSPWKNVIWTVTDVTVNPDNSHSIKLTNLATGKSIASADEFVNNTGRLIRVADTPAAITLKANPGAKSFYLEVAENTPIWPYLENANSNAGCVTSGIAKANDTEYANFSHMMGADWTAIEVVPTTYKCITTDGVELFTGVGGAGDPSLVNPEFKNHELKSIDTNAASKVITLTYERTASDVTLRARLENGALITLSDTTVAKGNSLAVKAPEVGEFFTLSSVSTGDATSITPSSDMLIDFIFTTDSHLGVKDAGPEVTEITPGNLYLIYDNSTSNGRNAYRYATDAKKVSGTKTLNNATANHIWSFETLDTGLAIKNEGLGLYVQNVVKNQQGSLAKSAKAFDVTYTAPAWTIKNAGNNQAWDGQESLNMVGWDAPGHPHKIFSFFLQPYFIVTIQGVDENGANLGKATTVWVKAGEAYTPEIPEKKGYEIVSVAGNENLNAVKADTDIIVTYAKEGSAISQIEASKTNNSGIFNLQGQRLNRISGKGIYIVNGHKILAK